MESNDQKYYFVTDCYNKKVDETEVYAAYIRKSIIEMGTGQARLNDLRTRICTDYKIDIPTAVIDSALRRLSNRESFIYYEDELLTVDKIPPGIAEHYELFHRQYEADLFSIYESFQQYLESVGGPEINRKQFIEVMGRVRDRIMKLGGSNTIRPPSVPEDDKLFFDWIYSLYSQNPKPHVVGPLNKLLFSLLLYSFFTSPGTELQDSDIKRVFLDTNIVIYAFGINGVARQKMVEEFAHFAIKNKIKVSIIDITLAEVANVVRQPPNADVGAFVEQYPGPAALIVGNTEEAVRNKFASIGLSIDIASYSTKAKDPVSFPKKKKDLIDSLSRFRKETGNGKVRGSVEHDVNALMYTGAVTEVQAIQREGVFLTADNGLLFWYQNEPDTRSLLNTHSAVVHLTKMTLLLWVEGKLAEPAAFLPKVWSYVADAVPYFQDTSAQLIFKSYREKIVASPIPRAWRTPYIFLRNEGNLPEGRRTRQEDMIAAVERLNSKFVADLVGEKASLEAALSAKSQEAEQSLRLAETYRRRSFRSEEERAALDLKTRMEQSPFVTFLEYLGRKYRKLGWLLKLLDFFGL